MLFLNEYYHIPVSQNLIMILLILILLLIIIIRIITQISKFLAQDNDFPAF